MKKKKLCFCKIFTGEKVSVVCKMGFEELSSSALVLFPLPVLFINNCTNDLSQCCESTTPKVLLLPRLMLVNETGPGRAVRLWPTIAHPVEHLACSTAQQLCMAIYSSSQLSTAHLGTLCAPSVPNALVWPNHPLQEPRRWPNIAFGFSVGALSWPVCFPTVDGTHLLILVSSCCYFSHYFKSIRNIIFTCHYFYLQLFLFSQQYVDI